MSTQTTFDTLDLNDEQPDEPTTDDLIDYADITTEDDLIEYSQQYAEHALTEYDIDVNLDRITHWEVSKRAKRRAAAVICANIEKGTPRGINTKIGAYIDWDDLLDTTDINTRVKNSNMPVNDVRNVGMTLSWRAFEAFDEEEWRNTIRHELIHVEQYQKYGYSNHGRQFKTRAEELDTENGCPRFYTGKYLLVCSECGDVVGDRTRMCKTVRMADPDHEKSNDRLKDTDCCDAQLTLEINENTD